MSKLLSIGRFAPSPTGPLHFGSLVAAVSSYLNVKQKNGKWLVRIEDIDPPREVPGSSDKILSQLERHGLFWDGQIVYQSSRLERYHEILNQLSRDGFVYSCQCNRQRLIALNGVYDGKCRNLGLGSKNNSSRIAIDRVVSNLDHSSDTIAFNDKIMGYYSQHLLREVGDFVLQRRDGLISYQLAVVVDDFEQGITQIVRGTDLLESTPRQILLQKCLKYTTPDYIHIPLVVDCSGQKLSKQNFAKSIIDGRENETLWIALKWLQQNPPQELRQESVTKILNWGIAHWDLSKLPKSIQSIAVPHDLDTAE